jgi:hypothetical protein
MLVNRVKPQTAAGKPSKPRGNHAQLSVAITLITLFALLVSAGPAFAEFGLEKVAVSARNENGTPSVQAGAHPYELTTTFVINQAPLNEPPEGTLKDVRLELPPGFVGDPEATPRCEYTAFLSGTCSNESAIGVGTVYPQDNYPNDEISTFTDPVYNLVPPRGVVAEFAYLAGGDTPVLLQSTVRTGADYGVTVNVQDINQALLIGANKVTIWGVPGDPSHDAWRGNCEKKNAVGGQYPLETPGKGLGVSEFELEGPMYKQGEKAPGGGMPESAGECPSGAPELPLLTNPVACGVPRPATLSADDWEEPGVFRAKRVPMPEMVGCEKLALSPTLTVTPDKPDASMSSGLAVDVKMPQGATANAVGLAAADVRDTTVVLPPGVALNPSSANGLEACSEGLAGFTGMNGEINPGSETATFTPFLPGGTTALLAGESALFQAGVNFCPNASKIGTVRIKLAVLEHPLEGAIYLAAQEANPFGSLLAIYFVAEDPVSGVLVKLPGEVTLCKSVGEDPLNASGEPIPGVTCQAVGQVVTTLENTPQAPVEEFEAHFYGGEKAPLTTPAHCGTYTTETSFVSWSGETKHPFAPMEITSGPNGGACPGSSLPFSPTLRGAALNINAGAFSPFTATMSRSDGEQNLQSLEVHLPPGLSGILSNIELCPEPQANLGECGPNSLIGETTVSVGVGGDPYTDTGGKFYLTGPYNGSGGCNVLETGCAPFGITFEVPAKAGPFDLAHTKSFSPACDCILVRGKIEVNPLTAAITITSNPPGTTDAIPTEIEGVPLEIQHVNAITTRGSFQFNPTNCSKMEVTGTIHSSVGGTDTIGVPFQVTNCQALKFEPKLAVSTQAKTSRADGASLAFKFTNPSAPQGTQANYAKFKVELPKQLPSRLTTLQKACTAAQFNANPAGCPSASVVGHMKVSTPVLPVPLEGPLYFVSNGGEAFPNLIVVLQGYGVTARLVGDTFISKAGITSSTFKAIPDFPFTSAEVVLPEGPYSALAANGNLCLQASKLKIPTEFVGQNGAELKQDNQISVTGCSSALSVVSSKVNKKTLTLSVYAPAAGKVTASGKGVSAGVKTYSGEGALTFTLKQKKAGKLKTKIKLTFTPSTGNTQRARGKQAKTLSVKFKK